MSLESTPNENVAPNCRGEDVIETGASPRSPPPKERPTSPRGVSSSDPQHPLRLSATETIAKANKFVIGVRKLSETRKIRRIADADVHHGFDENLDPDTRVELNAEEVRRHHVHEERIGTLRFPPSFLKIGKLGNYDYLTPLLDAVLGPHDHRADVVLFRKEVLYPVDMVWKADSVERIFHSDLLMEISLRRMCGGV